MNEFNSISELAIMTGNMTGINIVLICKRASMYALNEAMKLIAHD